jgi:DNA-binding MarR family transcriptional regulator
MGQVLMRRLCQTKPFGSPVGEAAVNLLLAGAWLNDRLDQVLVPLGISHAQYNVLRILRGAHPDGHPRGEIARRMIDRAPDVTRLIDRLARRGLVERAPGQQDRRTSITRITAKGRALLDKAEEPFKSVHRELERRLATRGHCEQLSRLCEAVYGEDVE